MFIFDAHLDLAMNALEWNRDLTRPIREIRERESGLTDKPIAVVARFVCRNCAAATLAWWWPRKSPDTPNRPIPCPAGAPRRRRGR